MWVNLKHLSSWGQVAFNSLKNVQLATGMWSCLSCDANPLLKLVDCMSNMLCMWSARGGGKKTTSIFLFFFLTCCLHSWRRQTTRTERAKIAICSSTHCLLLFSIVFNPQLSPHLVIVLYWSLKHQTGHHVKGIWGGRSGAAEWRSRPQNHNLEYWWWWSARYHTCHHACRARKLLTGTDKKKKQIPLQKTSMSQVLACFTFFIFKLLSGTSWEWVHCNALQVLA